MELASRLKLRHGVREPLRVLAKQIEEISLEIAADPNVHRRGACLRHGMLVVVTCGKEPVQDIIRVRGHDEVFHREAHALGIVACQDIPEVARWHAEGDRAIALREQLVVGVEVVSDLEHDPGPIDGVHSSETILRLEIQLSEKTLDNVLAIVECALDSNAMHVGVKHAGHLLLLDLRHPALREQYETLHVFLAPQAVDGCATCISAGRPKYGEPSLVAPQEVLVYVAKRLQGDVLEGECGAVEKLHNVHVTNLLRGNCLWVGEGLVAAEHDLTEIRCRDLVLGTVQRGDFECQLAETQLAPPFVLPRDIREHVRNHQSPIRRQTLEDRLLEGEAGGATACAPVSDRLRGHG
mmetsp:Transcript_55502/g.141105  ORF Transcript_55502/g.141105 Transcript_55502/m.141105 type:complete len:352 (-) Transcript_55502:85-1140(-)